MSSSESGSDDEDAQTLLLTGFGPFANFEDSNPSWDVSLCLCMPFKKKRRIGSAASSLIRLGVDQRFVLEPLQRDTRSSLTKARSHLRHVSHQLFFLLLLPPLPRSP